MKILWAPGNSCAAEKAKKEAFQKRIRLCSWTYPYQENGQNQPSDVFRKPLLMYQKTLTGSAPIIQKSAAHPCLPLLFYG